MSVAVHTRPASLADLDSLLAHVQAGFASYTEFAPRGWRPRAVTRDREWTAELLSDPDTWTLLALVGERTAGHVSFFPAREREAHDERHWRRRPKVPGLAHLWQLFVLAEWWGRGVAPVLHEAAVAEMTTRGFERARLYTPTQQLRARRFYERRGWRAVGEQWSPELELPLTEYRLVLIASSRLSG